MILWDADGVLMQTFTEDGLFCWTLTIEEELGMTEAQASGPFHDGWDDVLLGRRDALDAISAHFTAKGITVSPERFLDYWLEKDCRINERVAAQMRRFGGCIATNQDRRRSTLLAQWFAPDIRKVFASSAIGAMKPDPIYFLTIEDALDLEPEQLCLIDDSLTNIKAARERGWQGHHFTGVERLQAFLDTLTPEIAGI